MSPGKPLIGFEQLYLNASYSHHAGYSEAAAWQPAFASKVDKTYSNGQYKKRPYVQPPILGIYLALGT